MQSNCNVRHARRGEKFLQLVSFCSCSAVPWFGQVYFLCGITKDTTLTTSVRMNVDIQTTSGPLRWTRENEHTNDTALFSYLSERVKNNNKTLTTTGGERKKNTTTTTTTSVRSHVFRVETPNSCRHFIKHGNICIIEIIIRLQVWGQASFWRKRGLHILRIKQEIHDIFIQ